MSFTSLGKMFCPTSIAVIGASEKQGSIGAALMCNILEGKFEGKIYPVNPKQKTINGIPAYSSIREIGAPVDLVVVSTPIASTPGIVKECVEAEAGGAVIISGGGKETGEEGHKVEKAIMAEAKESGLRIIGPNCLGIICTRSKLNASFASHMPLPGKMAFISQSGAICTSVLDISIQEKMGFSYFISLGSMLDVDFGDIIDYIGGDPSVSSIVMYIESLTRFRNFMSAARSVSRIKPIIALKTGRSKAGAAAAASHTGALAGEDAVYDAAFKRAGVVRVKTFEELFDCAELLSKQPRPSGCALGIVTNAGGPGVMAADALSDYGTEPAQLSADTIEKLNGVLPPFWSHNNPVDILGDATPERFHKVTEICLNAPEINGLLLMTAPQALIDPTTLAEGVVDLLRNKRFPVFASWLGGPDMYKGRDIFNQASIPTFDTPERAVRAFMDLYYHARNIEMLQQIPPALPKKLEFDSKGAGAIIHKALENNNLLLTENISKELLLTYGIPINPTDLAKTSEEAANIAKKQGFPVVVKIFSEDITHKSDVDGVRLNLKTENEVKIAFNEIMEKARAVYPNARVSGVTIQPMLKHLGYELILGVKKDRDFGPVILFGMGGVMTEVIKDRAIALPPLNRVLARKLIEETRVYRLLKGYRNFPPVDLTKMEEILMRLAQLATDFAEIKELDINPLLITKDGVILAADARVLLEHAPVSSPFHLVISPYPNDQEGEMKTEEGETLFIRPIRPEDAPLFRHLFDRLSPRSVYFRFFRPVKELSHDMLARFTQIDYDREIALVALYNPKNGEAGEQMLGVARVMREQNPKHSEFSVLIRDDWQGKGVGAALLGRCLEIAKKQCIQKVWGLVLPENTQMLNLGRKLGFQIKRIPDSNEYELTIVFDSK